MTPLTRFTACAASPSGLFEICSAVTAADDADRGALRVERVADGSALARGSGHDLRLELDRRGGEADVLLERLARVEQQTRYLLRREADPARLDCNGSGGHVGEREPAVDAGSHGDHRADDLHARVGDADARGGVDDAADDAASGRLRFALRGELTRQRDEEKKNEPANQ